MSVVPEKDTSYKVNTRQYYSEKIRQILLTNGFSEVITSSFQKKDKIQLQNALASDKSYVRSSLCKNISSVLDANFAHTDLLGIRAVRVFEIGTVFTTSESGISEHLSLGIGVRQKGNGYTPKDDAPLQEVLTILESELGVTLDSQPDHGVAEVNLTDLLAALPAPETYDPMVDRQVQTYTTVSQYPAIARDIALWVSTEFTADRVAAILKEAAGSLCIRIDLFDEFEKDGRKSYAFRLVFQSTERTLTDSEVGGIMETVNQVAEQNGWQVR